MDWFYLYFSQPAFVHFLPSLKYIYIVNLSYFCYDLKDLVDLARMTASTANSQALKFKLVNMREDNAKVFETLAWAGALPDWPGPEKGERPSAYILIAEDRTIGKNKLTDTGIMAQTMMLGAVEKGYMIQLVLALGKPKEEVKVVPVGEDGKVTYYRGQNQIHYVPKRSLEDLILD